MQRLSGGPASVGDLAGELDLTPNAIRASLAKLEADGFVRQSGKRAAVRKPETLYSLTPESAQLFPRAYHLLFNHLVDGLLARQSAADVEELLMEVGRTLAARHPPDGGEVTPSQRVHHAAAVLRDLGGLPKVRRNGGRWVIEGQRCPLESAVREHPAVCRLAQAMLSQIVGLPVLERCVRNGDPHCRFEIGGGSG